MSTDCLDQGRAAVFVEIGWLVTKASSMTEILSQKEGVWFETSILLVVRRCSQFGRLEEVCAAWGGWEMQELARFAEERRGDRGARKVVFLKLGSHEGGS